MSPGGLAVGLSGSGSPIERGARRCSEAGRAR
jgi:hypothetical protein